MKDYKIAATILLGIVLMIVTVVLVAIVMSKRPPKLSQEKMQKNVEEAQKAEKKNIQRSETENKSENEDTGYFKELEGFDVTAMQNLEIDNRTNRIGKVSYV